MSRRITPDDKPMALAHYHHLRTVWSKPASYWITVYEYGHTYNRLMAVFMLAMMGITEADIEHYKPGGVQ